MKKLVIVGASGHGRVIADIAVANGYRDIIFLDDDPKLNMAAGFPVAGTSKDAANYPDADFIVAIGNAGIRKKIQEKLPNVVTLVHPSAVLGRDVLLGEGSVVMAGAVINYGARIGKGCIVNTCASVDHDCVIEDYVHVSVGSHVAGTVHIGEGTWVGAGAVISNNVEICANCMVGAGAVVVKDITEPGTYVGVPAKKNKG